MTKIHTIFASFFITISATVFSQETDVGEVLDTRLDSNKNTKPLDSATVAKRKAYEEQLKRAEAFRKGMAKDPKRFMDSLNAIRNEKLRVEALERIAAYESNPELASLKEIDLSNAQLSDLPGFVFEAKSAEVLILDGNRIEELPAKLSQLEKLNRIYWRNNSLDSKVKIPRLEGIEKLDLSNNNLKRLPKVHRIKGIKELVLEKNSFEKIPLWRVWRLKDLHELEISQNPIKLDRRWYWLIKNLKVLKVNKSDLTTIHPSLYKMRGLEELQLQVNKLNTIPEGISRLEQLTKLSFYKNSIDSLPSDIFKLKNLEIIDLYYNELEVVPSEIGGLENLQILYLSFNEIYDLPEEVGELKQLRELYIHHNRLSQLPESIANLDHLKVLHFQNNYIPQFPYFILSMESIEDLDISETDITSLPLEIEDMDLKTFFWRDLNINMNSAENEAQRDMILRMMERDMVMNPKVFDKANGSE